jgi:molybdate transport system permease protein
MHIFNALILSPHIVGYPSLLRQYNQKMDIDAILLSLKLAFWTMALMLPFGIWVAHKLVKLNKTRPWFEAALALPLVLPPTVLGYYFLVSFGNTSIFGFQLVFSFAGILIASLIVNIPFAIQPIQRAFEAINPEIREAAQVSGLTNWQIFRLIELPLSWRGITGAAALTFAHTLGEFGVVLMVGGAIPGETKTASIAIYDKVQGFDTSGAGSLALVLLGISLVCIALSYGVLGRNRNRRRGLI